jgi:hypothetical protein
MVSNEDALLIGGGAAAGVGIPYLMRKYADVDEAGQLRVMVEQLGTYSTPSAITGIVGGTAGIAIGMFGNKIGIRDQRIQTAAFAFGVPALVTGLMSGYEPVQPCAAVASGARARVIRSGASPMRQSAAPSVARRPLVY